MKEMTVELSEEFCDELLENELLKQLQGLKQMYLQREEGTGFAMRYEDRDRDLEYIDNLVKSMIAAYCYNSLCDYEDEMSDWEQEKALNYLMLEEENNTYDDYNLEVRQRYNDLLPALDDELTVCQLGSVDSFNSSREALKQLISWHIDTTEYFAKDKMFQKLNQVNRVEVIDEMGRSYVNSFVCGTELSFQDDDKTLKIFLETDPRTKAK